MCVPSPSARGEDIFALGCRADLKPRHIPELFCLDGNILVKFTRRVVA